MGPPWTLLGAPLDSSGAGRGEQRAPAALRAAGLPDRLGLRDAGNACGPLRDPRRDPGSGVIAAAQLAGESRALRDAVAATLARGERPFVLGGDCSLMPGALAGVRAHGGPLRLWMVDGHPDALDGATSPTGEAADMGLAVVSGRGAPALTGLAGTVPIVAPADVALLGHRPASLAPEVAAELALVPEAVAQVTAPALRRRGAAAVAGHVARAGAGTPAWLHLDLDVLDGGVFEAVSYPQPEGLGLGELRDLLRPLLAAPELVGVSLADLDAGHPRAGAYAALAVELLASAWPPAR